MFGSNGRFGSFGLLSLIEFISEAAPGVTKLGTRFAEKVVLTAYLPSMVRLPSLRDCVAGFQLDRKPAGIDWFHCGAAAATRNWWLRNEPPKAAWKKLSSSVYCAASCPSGRLFESM